MTSTIFLESIAIFIGTLVSIFGAIVYPELRNFDRRKETFRRDYQDKVQVLKVKAQDRFIENIIKSEKLKRLFGSSDADDTRSDPFTIQELDKIETEIQNLVESFYYIQRPNDLFNEVISNFDDQKKELKELSLYGFVFSLMIPSSLLDYFGHASYNEKIGIAALLFIFATFLLVLFLNRLILYKRGSSKLDNNVNEMSKVVSEKIYNIKDRGEFDDEILL